MVANCISYSFSIFYKNIHLLLFEKFWIEEVWFSIRSINFHYYLTRSSREYFLSPPSASKQSHNQPKKLVLSTFCLSSSILCLSAYCKIPSLWSLYIILNSFISWFTENTAKTAVLQYCMMQRLNTLPFSISPWCHEMIINKIKSSCWGCRTFC